MDTDRSFVVAVVGVVVVTSLLSGPVVGVLDVAPAGQASDYAPGEGMAVVENVTLPDEVSIERGEFGAGSYYLKVPTATATVVQVSGRPILSYTVDIDGLGYSLTSNHYLSSEHVGEKRLTMASANFAPDEISSSRHEGTLTVTLRSTEGSTTLASSNLTIEVSR